MSSFHLKGAILCPQIDRIGDAGASSLVHLDMPIRTRPISEKRGGLCPYHFGRLGTRDVEFEISILLPVTEQQGELEEESIVCGAEGSQSLRARVSVETAFESFAGAYQFLPVLEVVGIGILDAMAMSSG